MSLRRLKDVVSSRVMWVVASLVILLVPVLFVALYLRSQPVLETRSLFDLLRLRTWSPLRGQFGLLPFVLGTLWVTLAAMAIAVPLCLLSAIYLAEYAPPRVRNAVLPVVDLLAGIPSVVYGVWGVLFVVPLIRDHLIPFAERYLHAVPLVSPQANKTGYSVLAGAVVLAVMVFPIILSVTHEVIRTVPRSLREAALSLGATRWETTKRVVLRRAMPGVLAAVVLGFSRAFGETMAVLMVVGNVPRSPASLFDAAYPLPALIANSYGEMMSIPLYDSALMLSALVLLLIVLAFTVVARVLLIRAVRRSI